MCVTASASGRAARVDLAGDLDLSVADGLRTTLLTLTRERELVVVDLRRVTFVDSTILGVVAAAWKRMRAQGGQLVAVHPVPRVLRVLELTMLADHILGDRVSIAPELKPEFDELVGAGG